MTVIFVNVENNDVFMHGATTDGAFIPDKGDVVVTPAKQAFMVIQRTMVMEQKVMILNKPGEDPNSNVNVELQLICRPVTPMDPQEVQDAITS